MTLDGEGMEILTDRDKSLNSLIASFISGDGKSMTETSLRSGVSKLNKIELETVSSIEDVLRNIPVNILNLRKLTNTLERIYKALELVKDEINKDHSVRPIKKDDDGIALLGTVAVGVVLGIAL